MSKTISGLPLAETLTGDELLPVVQDGNTVQSTIQQVADLVGNTTTWGDIQGTLSNQTDLQTALDAKVPYTGATGNVNLGEYGLTSGYFQADLTPTNALQVGRMQWNDQDGTMDLRLKGNNVTLQIGQEQVIRVVNKTGATLTETDYQCVKISGAQGQRPKVDLAQANNDANSADTIGLVTETISNNQEGFVTTSGLVRNINTTGSMQGETWADGDVLYLSGTTAGRLTNIKPQAPIHTVIVGFVVYAHNNQGKIFVKVDNGYELNELHNVRINGVTDGQVLAYDSTLSVWENINQSAITSGNSDKVDGYHVQVDGTGTDPNTIYFKTTGGVDPSAAVWGDITGSIVDQTDLYNALVNGTYATGNWNINAASVDGYSVQVDGTGTDPNTIYFKTTGGTISVDWDDVANTPTTVSGYGITDAVTTSGNQTIGGTKTFSSTITGSITGNADTVDGYNVQVDGTGTDPNTIYFKTTGGSISVDWDDVSNTPTTVAGYGITDAVTASGNQTVGGTKTFSSTITGSITGNAGTVTNGVYTSGDQTIGGTKTFSSTISGSIDGNSNTVDGYHVQVDGTGTDPNTIYFKTTGGSIGVDWDDVSNTPTTVAGYGITDAVTTSGNQTIGGTKTFSSTITGSITGNAGTVTDGVYLSGTQTITGNKTFTGSVTMGQSGGGEGGEIFWLDPVQGTVVTDVPASGAFRVFQASGTAKGAYIDLANCAGGVGSLLLHSTNYNSFAPTLTGTGASGTWGISVTGNAGTVTNGVYTTGDQTIGGTKTFSTELRVPSFAGTNSFISGTGDGASLSTYNFALSGWNGMAFYNPTVGGVFPTSTTGVVNFRDGIIEMRGSLRAPIFYDSANTSYYLDPANTGTSMVVAGDVGIGSESRPFRLTVANNTFDGMWAGSSGTYSFVGLGGYFSGTAGASQIGYERTTGLITFSGGTRDTPVTRMSINSSGNVGIGTTSPGRRLSIAGGGFAFDDANTTSRSVHWGDGTTYPLLIQGDVTNGFISFNTHASGSGPPERLRIDSAGKVLIGAGATASLGKLVVSEASSGTAVIALESQGSWNSTIACTSTGNLVLRNNGASDRMVFDPYGNIITYGPMFASIYYDNDNSAYYLDPANSGTSMAVAGDIVASNLKTSANTALSLGLYTGTAFNTGGAAISLRGSTTGYNNNGMEFYAGNSERMRINSSGNVGIGTTSPAYRLDVAGGEARIANDIGGTFGGQLKLVNSASGATNPDKSFRIGPTGNLEIINSAYNAVPFTFTDAGILSISAECNAPVFKDVNNSAYFLDPSNTGTALNVAGAIQLPNNKSLLFRNAANTASASFLLQSDDNFVVYNAAFAPIISFGQGASPSAVYGANASNRMIVNGSSNIISFNVDGTEKLTINGSGNLVATGNVTAYSDIRVKDNVENITGAIGKLNQIRGVTYTRIDLDDKERKYAGVIAQEIEQVLPEAVFDNGKVKSVDYNATIALLIEAVKEQQGQINELKLTIEQLKGN